VKSLNQSANFNRKSISGLLAFTGFVLLALNNIV